MARRGGPGSRAYPNAGKGGGIIRSPIPPTAPTKGSSGKPPGKKKDCCPMVAAVRSIKRGKFKLARRYAAMSIRLMVA